MSAHCEDAPSHDAYRRWWDACITSLEAFRSARRSSPASCTIFRPPTPLDAAMRFAREVKARPNFVEVRADTRHWDIFLELCRRANARGNLITDAYLAALAIESGSEWITTDREYSRFPGLRWRHPLE